MSENDEAEFELHCDGEYAASACGPRRQAWREILRYAAQYAQDGPVKIFEVTRREVPLSLPSPLQGAHEVKLPSVAAAIREEGE